MPAVLKSIYYSVDRANRTLILVKSITRDISRTWRRIEYQQQVVEAARLGTLRKPTENKLQLLIDKINGYIIELDQLSLQIAEFKRGIILFPTTAMRDGTTVSAQLLWKLGDTSIQTWKYADADLDERNWHRIHS